jgi:CBS domain-containing protein
MIIGEISLHELPHLVARSSVAEAGVALRDALGGVVAVVEEGRLLGSVSERDLAVKACAGGQDPNTVTVAEIFDSHPVVCAFDADLKYALGLMREHRQTWLIVSNGNGAPAGAVSLLQLLEVIDDFVPEESTGPEPEYVHRVRGDTGS